MSVSLEPGQRWRNTAGERRLIDSLARAGRGYTVWWRPIRYFGTSYGTAQTVFEAWIRRTKAEMESEMPENTDPMARMLDSVRRHEEALADGKKPMLVPEGLAHDEMLRLLAKGSPAGYDLAALSEEASLTFMRALSEKNAGA